MQLFDGTHAESFVQWMFFDQPTEVRSAILQSIYDIFDDVRGPEGFVGIEVSVTPDVRIVAYAMLYPGKLAIVTGPRCCTNKPTTHDAAIIAVAAEVSKALAQIAKSRWNVSMVQATIPFESNFESQSLIHGGFQYLATLHQLIVLFPLTQELSSGSPAMTQWQRVGHEQLPLVECWLDSTYKETLDCPELSQLRSTPDALAGYWDIATGKSSARVSMTTAKEPEWWMKMTRNECDQRVIQTGVLLTPIQPLVWELTYFGVAQPYRGQGLGKETLQLTLQRLQQLGARQLYAYVDSRNEPAIRMYDQAGFRLSGSWNALHWPLLQAS